MKSRIAGQSNTGMLTVSTMRVVSLLANFPTHTVPDLMQVFQFGGKNKLVRFAFMAVLLGVYFYQGTVQD